VAVLTDPGGAAEAGASGLPVLVVDDPRGVLGVLAAWLYGHPAAAMPVVGITGTNGKTTTAYLVEGGLRHAGHRTGLSAPSRPASATRASPASVRRRRHLTCRRCWRSCASAR
jgi:hypothetical protein